MQLRKEAWKKFRNSTWFEASFCNCINCVHCDDQFFIFISFLQFIYDLFHISLTIIIIMIIIIASQHAGTNTTSSRSLTWTPNVDCVAISTRPLTTWSLAALNWLKLSTSTTTTRQLHTCTGRSAKSLALRWRNDGMSMNPGLSPRMTESLFCGTCPFTLTGPKWLIGRTLC